MWTFASHFFWCSDPLGASIGTLVVLSVDPLGDSIVTLAVPGFDLLGNSIVTLLVPGWGSILRVRLVCGAVFHPFMLFDTTASQPEHCGTQCVGRPKDRGKLP